MIFGEVQFSEQKLTRALKHNMHAENLKVTFTN